MLLVYFVVLLYVGDGLASKAPRCGENASYKECPTSCPPTCENPNPEICNRRCLESGCECDRGFVLNDRKCIRFEDCPGAKYCSCNQTYVACKSGCPTDYCPQDDGRYVVACDQPYPCPPGCVCKGNYLKLNYEDQRCILASECPPVQCTRPNEEWNKCPSICLAEYCSDLYDKHELSECQNDYPHYCNPRCVCKQNFYRNDNDECVPADECPEPVHLVCGYNEEPVKCRTICPPQNCDIAYTDYACTDSPKCEPGCDCIEGYLRNKNGICIPSDTCFDPSIQCEDQNSTYTDCLSACPATCDYSPEACIAMCNGEGCECNPGYVLHNGNCISPEDCPIPQPKCGLNEVLSPCKITCPPQSCDSIYTSYLCAQQESDSCDPGCNCIDGYLRNSDGICIPSEQCTVPTCDLSNRCLPTCANPKPDNCCAVDYGCPDGYILSEMGGTCIKIEDCPQYEGCNGDPNAVIQNCPWSSPATCDSPNASYDGKCESADCVCAPGYLLDKIGGKCILPDQCPGGDPCGRNASFSDCAFRCPNQYCPEDDSLLEVICKPGRSCPPGCVCKYDYKLNSYEDDTCIHASDCPLVDCTRPNEVWNSCPRCLADNCEDYNVPNICDDIPGTNCEPQCVCIEDYYRNESGDCVPLEECPKKCPVPEECRPTCAVPIPQCCEAVAETDCNEDGCRCKPGYILSEIGGECIKIEECPTNIGCNGDEYAVIKQCPSPCPSTCDSPDEIPCKRACATVGCECAPGYILSEIEGKCILPDECIGGNPCGHNETFVPCKYNCPTNYCPVDDSRNPVICDPTNPCLSGCACNMNNLRLSLEQPRCIASYDCPPVDCTRENEVWDSCPSACLAEYCENVDDQPVVCHTLIFQCNPRCVCKKNYFRDSNDICIPAHKCREINKQKECH